MTLPTSQHTCPECQQIFSLIITSCHYVVCPHCDSNLSLHAGKLHLIQKNTQQVPQEKSLRIGDVANINEGFFRNKTQRYTIIAWVDYEKLSRENYESWREYLLTTDKNDLIWLSESNKGWHIINYTLSLDKFSEEINNLTNQVSEQKNELNTGFFQRFTIRLDSITANKVTHMAGAFKQRKILNEINTSRLYIIFQHKNPRHKSPFFYSDNRYQRVLLNQAWYWRQETFINHSQIKKWFNKNIAIPNTTNVGGDKIVLFKQGLFILSALTLLEILYYIISSRHFSILDFFLIPTINGIAAAMLFYIATLTHMEHKRYYTVGAFIIYIASMIIGEIIGAL